MTQHPPHTTPPPSTPADVPKPGGHQPGRYAGNPAPVEVDASTELTACFGLEPEQEIRSRALTEAQLLHHSDLVNTPRATASVIDMAARFAAFIRDGSRP